MAGVLDVPKPPPPEGSRMPSPLLAMLLGAVIATRAELRPGMEVAISHGSTRP